MKKNITKKRIELLCPAGDLERLKTAVVFGADAVYCGLSDFSLRAARELNFTIETLNEGIKFAHDHGVKVYLTFNIFPHEWMMENIRKKLEEIKEKLDTVDGIIVSDLGMFSLVKEYLPNIEIHVSTQANTLNTEAIKMWGELGATRVVLARELTIDEIKDIKQKLQISPFFAKASKGDFNREIEIEVFGHGAMCMAYSGRCLLSKYFTGREANLGECAQPCRWKYRIKNNESRIMNNELESNNSRFQIPDSRFYIEEENRPGDLLRVEEDVSGTYFMNSKDLCVLDILDQFIESGINSLKIEGRTKSAFYVAVVTYVYRKAIDYYREFSRIKTNSREWGKEKLVKELFEELNLIQNRGYSHGFLMGRNDYEQEYDFAAIRPSVIPLGQIVGANGIRPKRYLVDVNNKFKVGEEIEILTPNEIIKTKIKEIKSNPVETNGRSSSMQEILKPKEKVWVKFDTKKEISERSFLRRRIKK